MNARMDKDSTVTLSGFCEHVISKTESEIYRITGSSSLKFRTGRLVGENAEPN